MKMFYFFSDGLAKFQFVIIDVSKRLDKLASAMLESLNSLTGDSIFIIDDSAAVNFDELPKKTTFLFVSSQFAATMTSKPTQIETIFILEDDKTKVDHRERFATDVDLIFQLADVIYRCYTEEARECLAFKNSSMAKRKEQLANQIHDELKKVYKSVVTGNNVITAAIDTTTTIVWLQSKLQNDMEVEKLHEFLDDVVSPFQSFVSKFDCQNYLRKNEFCGAVFLMIHADYEDSVVADFPIVMGKHHRKMKQLSTNTMIFAFN
jgi:hypothetical protein